jgi:hypothetical protein
MKEFGKIEVGHTLKRKNLFSLIFFKKTDYSIVADGMMKKIVHVIQHHNASIIFRKS